MSDNTTHLSPSYAHVHIDSAPYSCSVQLAGVHSLVPCEYYGAITYLRSHPPYGPKNVSGCVDTFASTLLADLGGAKVTYLKDHKRCHCMIR